ncbi:MAG: helix-turn-helix transcriptional regulator [Polaribacter sp.]
MIPYRTRKKNKKRRDLRLNKRLQNFERLEKKYKEVKIINLKNDNDKLQVNLKDDLSKILNTKYNEVDLESFYSNFEKLYPNFNQTLYKITPNLTANELKLSAFLRLNLSSKEISKLLNINPESVNKARYRLRKKLQLSAKDDLSTFIINL